MKTITKLIIPLVLVFLSFTINAQDKDSIVEQKVNLKIETLKEQKQKIEDEEKSTLKQKIENINKRLDSKNITSEEAEVLKKEAAQNTALNIQNRLAIVDSKIALIERNGYDKSKTKKENYLGIVENEEGSIAIGLSIGDRNKKPKKYDKRTTEDFVLAFGFNNALIDGQDLNDSPYKVAGSGFVEIGNAWKTRIFNNTNFWRLKYGVSLQWNKLDIKDNQYFVNTNGDVQLQTFPSEIKKAKFRTTNLVFPVHLEIGPSKKTERKEYFRYSTNNKFKLGLGGYGGLNIGSMQKLIYKENGDRVKDKQRGGFETNSFVYGLSGYVAFGDIALYAKYDLSPIFKNQSVDQNNISVGIRFDMD